MLKYSVITWKIAILWDTTLIIATFMNYTVLDKDTITNRILPHLPVAKRGFVSKACIIEIINAILYKLKVGCQWEHLPVEHLFSETVLKHGAVYHHYRKWCKGGHWKERYSTTFFHFLALISTPKHITDLLFSSIIKTCIHFHTISIFCPTFCPTIIFNRFITIYPKFFYSVESGHSGTSNIIRNIKVRLHRCVI